MPGLNSRAVDKRKLAAAILGRTGLRGLLGGVCRWSGLVCLNYHRIGDGRSSAFDRGLWSATADDFDAQVGFLKSNFDLIDADEIPNVLARPSGRYVLITFDDGYLDNYTTAFPILKRHGAPAAFFITTGFLDSPKLAWWDEIAWMMRSGAKQERIASERPGEPVGLDEPDREQAIQILLRDYKQISSDKTEGYLNDLGKAMGSGRHSEEEVTSEWMTWDMVREMRMAGMTIGGHTVNHPVLANMPREKQRQEIMQCGRRLFEELGEPMRYFSYPVGNRRAFNSETRDCLREAGVDYAFSYYNGFRRFNDWDDYDIRRIAVDSDITLDVFKAMARLPQWFGRP